MNATGRKRLDGYDPELLSKINDNEINEVEKIIYNAFIEKSDGGLAIFLPQFKKTMV